MWLNIQLDHKTPSAVAAQVEMMDGGQISINKDPSVSFDWLQRLQFLCQIRFACSSIYQQIRKVLILIII